MEGVEILNTSFVMPDWITVILVTVGVLSLGLVFGCAAGADSDVGVIVFFSLFVLTIIAGSIISTTRWGFILRYEATISEDVSFTEFNEKYKIIEQRGQIYILEERE